ncbi:ATP-dependent DNA helicase [Mycoplasmopsis canis UFG4]|uniref:DNA 3'-5' helicase n=2 Tax=Mycoplasmopsis canis TaxID=29555 RepID=I1A5W9_9BACT|nr:UvrD-helicase domain-containing protein [Mycoplasmopsis canis]AMD81046.1 ATP-dependent DNA helicase PcrA [Mycoplasmopsis canis PG 14]EIE41890.1 ATP-dependent DNA helicase [Mycoplasmopsis canis UFG4]AKF40932.1 ATP-dependent DNA helicase PcrA [Mycoplasmopsis canis]EIE39895.1 ATP-dependent DNA helicase [Mycoplasmopsis canis PG 14]EIE41677.1 ATP-dependent DNA helicase [Mycoplasmopsis canis UFG1]
MEVVFMLIRKVDLLSDLNEKQKQAVVYFDKPLRIIAGAGTGKTKVLTRKVAYLINDLGISPHSILAVTFTNKAAKEMISRIEKYCQNNKDTLNVQTFHAFCTSILRQDIRQLGYRKDFYIIDEHDKEQIFKKIYNKLEITAHEISYKTTAQYISWAKNYSEDPNEFAKILNEENKPTILAKIYLEYLNELALQGSLDFDDLIIQTHRLFTLRPDILEKYKKQFKFILIDEFQDTAGLQYEIIKMLYTENTHITIVGDPDQTIYNWRGANVNLILDFEKDFPEARTVILDINYRSTKKILEAANKLIKYNKIRFSKDLVTENEEGQEPEFFHSFNEEGEARWVVNKINELKKQKNQLKSIAILFRSNYYSRVFEQTLIEENIPHKLINGVKFYQRSEIKDAIAFLRVLFDGHEISLERIINVPNRGVGEVRLEKIREFARKHKKTMFYALKDHFKQLNVKELGKEFIINKLHPFMFLLIKYQKMLHAKKNRISRLLDSFLQEVGFYESIENNKNLRGTAKENVKELIKAIEVWEKANPSGNVEDYLNMVSLLTVTDEYHNETNYVTLMTIHSAKGLEYDNVFLVGLNKGVFPSLRIFEKGDFINNSKDKNPEELIEEERRLAYVAVTRAKKNLFLSSSRGKIIGTNTPKEPSQFLEEMGINTKERILLDDQSKFVPTTEDDPDALYKNSKIIVGDIISHVIFGEGEVIEVKSANDIIVKFHNDGKERTLNKMHPSIRLLSR